MRKVKQYFGIILAVILTAGSLQIPVMAAGDFGAPPAAVSGAAAGWGNHKIAGVPIEMTEDGNSAESGAADPVSDRAAENNAAESIGYIEGSSDEASADNDVIDRASDAAASAAGESADFYIVTLDANGGHFINEHDDLRNVTMETAQVLGKVVSVGGSIASFPVFDVTDENDQVQAMYFSGWSLERDGEPVSHGYEKYIPERSCTLFAVWTMNAPASGDTASAVSNAASGASDAVLAASDAASGASDAAGLDGSSSGTVFEDSSEGQSGNTNEDTDESLYETTDESLNEDQNENQNGNPDENQDGNLNGNPDENQDGNLNGNPDEMSDYNPEGQESREGSSVTDSAGEGAPDYYVPELEEAQEFEYGAEASGQDSKPASQDTMTEVTESGEDVKSQNMEKPSGGSTAGSGKDNEKKGTEIQEKPAAGENVESRALMAGPGSVDGNSKITWTDSTMPKAFNNTDIYLKRRAYLIKIQNGYMRVAYGGEFIIIEYYDTAFNMLRQGRLSMELDVWGGFFKGKDAYYIAEGNYNGDCVDGTEVLRIIKYDFDWNRIGAGRILAKEGWDYEIRYPFDYSCVNMDEMNGKLYLVTGREGYVDDSIGQGHQGMMLIRMDEKTFDTEIIYGDFWHSFAQYMCHSGQNLYLCELSEGGRCTSLSRLDTGKEITDTYNSFSDRFSVLDYGGSRTSMWAIPCYASADDMAVSSDNVLCLGTSIDQSQYDNVTLDMAHNIYLTVTPQANLDAEHTNVVWLTNYSGGGKCFIGTYITKINDDRFLITWEELPDEDKRFEPTSYRDPLSCGELHYVFVNGSGQKISEEFTARAMISDCKPILYGTRVVYYASDENCLDFYTIMADTGKFSKKVIRVAGDHITWDYDKNTLSFSGKGTLAVKIQAVLRSATSSISGAYAYSTDENCWKYVRHKVTGIKIGSGITSISENAFQDFRYVTDIKLPNGLKTIKKEAFSGCHSLGKLSIPDSVTKIGTNILSYYPSEYLNQGEPALTYAEIYGGCKSYAIEYAKKNNISYTVRHSWGSTPITTKATTKKNGKIFKKCSKCGKTVNQKVIYYPKKITLSKTSFIYNGKVQKPKITVKGSDGKTIAAKNYKLKYSSGCKNPGLYKVVITFKGNYTGKITKKFRIIPKGTSISKLTGGIRKFTVKWKKQAVQTSGYQIQYSSDRKFKKQKTVTIKNVKAVSKIFWKLSRKHTYYVRVRTFKTVGKVKYYSVWSKIKSVKTK